MADNSYDVIIIGAGFGGSSCAGLLAKRGLKVLLLDKNANAGGKAMSLSKNGFTYTPWVVIGSPVVDNIYQRMLDELEVADLATLAIPGTQGSFYKSPAGTYSRMPEAETDHLDPEIIFKWLGIPEEQQERPLEFFTNMALMEPEDVAKLDGQSFGDWITAAELPRALYAFIVSLCDGLFMVPVEKLDAAEAIVSLQGIFIRGGGVFCEGGFGKLAEAFCEAVRRYGSDVMMGTRVRRVIIEDGKVAGIETDKGQFKAPIVISNAGLQPTVLKLVGEEHFDQDFTTRVRELEPSYSLIGYRYFLSKPVTDAPFGVVFSDDGPWTQKRLDEAAAGKGSREGVLYFEVPSNYDPNAAPEGKQMLMTGCFCPPDPDLSKEELQAWASAGEEAAFGVFPELEAAIENKDFYTTRNVSSATRDSAVAGAGGETIGLAQIVGQCGSTKPSIKAPIEGLFFVGTDAGGVGVGTQQAIDSGMNVADAVEQYHQQRGDAVW
jgi:phytoene dehydrogenase-like protein